MRKPMRALPREADAGDKVEEEDFVHAVVSAGFEDPENVDQVGGEIREQEGDAVVDDGIAGADGNQHGNDLEVEQFGDGVGGGEGRHEFERAGVEQGDVDDCGDAAGDGVLDELDERGVLAAGELGQQVRHSWERLIGDLRVNVEPENGDGIHHE